MPGINLMPEEGMAIPKLQINIQMIIRFILIVINSIIIGIIGYYFAYYQGSYRNSIFHPELMMLICSVSSLINTSIVVKYQYKFY